MEWIARLVRKFCPIERRRSRNSFCKCGLTSVFEPICFRSKDVLIRSRNLYPNPVKNKHPRFILAQIFALDKAVDPSRVAVGPAGRPQGFWPRLGWLDRRGGQSNESIIA